MTKISMRGLMAISVSAAALFAGSHALAADAAPGATAGSGSEGTDVSQIVVTAERSKAAATAPTKASLTETQPESIISHTFIEAFRPETGDYTTTVAIAPSLAGVSSNGGGVGETNKITLRGFQDGQYNITYDGIFFGDTNDPTHHPASFFPSSTIGAAVVDRGPGAAGDLGQANYGGAIHFFSPTVTDKESLSQKLTYGTYNTVAAVTTIQSGALADLNGTKFLLNFDERRSSGELSNAGGVAQNQLFKAVVPITSNTSLTLFAAHNFTRFYQSDAGPGETWAQILAYGKNFALNTNPKDEHYYGDNVQKKQTDFEYAKLDGDIGSGISYEDQAYTYFYSNKTLSVDDITGVAVNNPAFPAAGSAGGPPNSDHVGNSALAKADPSDLGGYNKGNRYRVFGDIFRVNKEWSFGTLKVGGVVETSNTDRHNLLLDLTTGGPDNKYKTGILNAKTLENSSWNQYQLFGDFEWRPLDNLTIQPGFKWVHLTRSISAAEENSAASSNDGSTATLNFTRGPVNGSNTYEKPLYFLTANYRIKPFWSVYAQYATGFLIPSLSTLQSNNLQLDKLNPQESVNYQLGSVFTSGHITADADVYTIHISNLEQPDPTGQFLINAGTAQYSGVEGQGAYAFNFGLTLFANGSLNSAKNTTLNLTETTAPKWTDAVGALYQQGQWQGSVTYKQVGDQVAFYNGSAAVNTPDGVHLGANQARMLGAYGELDASVAYDFGRFKVKVAGTNLMDDRNLTTISGASATSLYTFQAGRQIQLTLQAKFF